MRPDVEDARCKSVAALSSTGFFRPFSYELQRNHIDFDKKSL